MSSNETAIVILNWNGEKYLKQFLPTVEKNSQGADIIIADNLSTDNSLEYLKNNHPNLEVIVLDKNHGFTGGYNRALNKIKGRYKYYLLLNSDIEVTPNWLRPLINLLDKDESIAACQPKILSFKNKDYFEHAGAAGGFMDQMIYPYCRGRIFESVEKDEGQYNQESEIFWATGACLLIRSNLFHEVGGFDERFFAHMEEIDVCWKLKNRGFKIYYSPDSHVYHVGGGTLQYNNPFKTYLNFRNSLYLIINNIPKETLFSILLKRLILDGVAGFHFLLRGYFKDFFAVLKAHGTFYKNLFPALKIRKNNLTEIKSNGYNDTSSNLIVWEHFIKGVNSYKDL